MRPRVSVLTPTLDAAEHLRDALGSLAAQTLPASEVEHIVIDGGSNDGTLDILSNAPRPVRILHSKGRNIYESMNDGIAAAHGEIVAWLNADDLLAPDALASACRALESNAQTHVAVADYAMFRDVDGVRHRWHYRTDGHELDRIRTGEFTRWFDIWVNPLPVFFRKSLLEAHGGYRTDAPLVADWDLWFRLAAAEPSVHMVHTGREAGSFRMHGGSLTAGTDPARMFVDKLRVMERFATDGSLPIGVRRSAARMYRHDALGLAAHEASTLPLGAAASHVVRAVMGTRSLAPHWALDLTSGVPTLTYEALSRVPGVRRLAGLAWAWSGGPTESIG